MENKSKRFLCWDESLMAACNNVRVIMNKPEKKNIALVCDEEWEGVHNGYGSLVRAGGVLRLYYRAMASRHQMDGSFSPGRAVICMAESHDGGITFRKPNLGMYEYGGSTFNNIVFSREEPIDNFSVFYDENPACPADEKFKALSAANSDEAGAVLRYYASADGITFREMRDLPIAGTFDSFNTVMWDETERQYHLYYRGFHGTDGTEKLNWRTDKIDLVNDIRDVRLAVSCDFVNWEIRGRIRFDEGQADTPLYTNQITKYFRSPDIYIGFPVRYNDRASDSENFRFMPLGDRHENITRIFGREGTSVTDCVLMTSPDGFTFNRRDEAFLTPGPESRNNWWYGNCYTVYGLTETEAEEYGASKEISFYVGENYRIKNANFRRFTIRLDGFFSWQAPFAGGSVQTNPITVTGEEMHLNFATSAMGGVKVTLCTKDGESLDGYSSYVMFGDSTDRPVEFDRPLSHLTGQEISVRFDMSDAHLYSFWFE